MTHEARAVAMFLRPLATLLRQHGIAPEPLFAQHGISVEDTRQPEARVSVAHTSELLTEAEHLLDDPSLGINMARHSEYSAFGGLGLALSAGGSLLSVLQRMVRFHRLISNAVRTELISEEDRVIVRFYADAGHTPHHQGMLYVMASLVRLVRIRIDPALNPAEVWVAYGAPDYLQCIGRYFRVTPQQGDLYQIVFSRNDAEAELHSSEPQLAAMMEASLNERLAEQERGSLLIQLSLWLEGRLPEGEPSLGDAAERFHMSVRSLQRRLSDEGMTWKQLLENTRRTLVGRHLHQPGMTVTQLAFLLGFSDVSAFSRAFKKWYGVAPSQFRSGVPRATE
jgi:AraC-like DNA-binding protein